ncbi:MAG TPA: site-specific DNA-methyltransferase [bacterium]|nr:site-specific DNA-methyltransferase [bacterium]HPN42752.1 site-specific DNA-methyltransferase [bacterium]
MFNININNNSSLLKPYYKTEYGKAYLGDTLDIIKYFPDDSINLILTSPPFALTSKKEYGNKNEEDYIDWFLQFSKEFKRVLTTDGSFVVDLGGAYLPGYPVRSIYQYELLCRMVKEQKYFLAQEFFHYNPARLPAPAEWVNVRRIRVKDSVNLVWWLSKTEYPKADNKNILRPYTEAMKSLLKKGYIAKKRPSGHDITEKFSKDHGGAIPPNVLELGNNDSNSNYMIKSLENGLKPHPARFPKRFAEFFIKFLTTEGDIVFDPFAGSNTTGYIAEQLERKWLSCEINETYVKNSMLRFEEEPNLFSFSKVELNGQNI